MDNLVEPKDRLVWARQNAGYESAADAARAMKIPEPTYQGHENGTRGFKKEADRYSQFFHVELGWLLTGRGSPKGKSKGIDEKPTLSTGAVKVLDTETAHDGEAQRETSMANKDEEDLLRIFRNLDSRRRVRLLNLAEDLHLAQRAADPSFTQRQSS